MSADLRAAIEAWADSEPLIVHGIRRDMVRTPYGRGGELRFLPATLGHGMSGCPGDNLVAWLDELRAILASDWLAQRDAAVRAEVWDDGYDAGHTDARAVQPTYPEPTCNPYRARTTGGDR